MDILVIHAGNKENAPDLSGMLPKGANTRYIDMKTYEKDDVHVKGADIVIAFHSLQTVEARNVPKVINKIVRDVNYQGEARFYVPAFEWAVAQSVEPDPSPAFHAVMFGSPDAPTRSAFTLQWLRNLVESTGMIIRQARHEPMELKNNDTVIVASINLVIGWKLIETETAKEAIE